jgi:hypothetical protein
LPLYYAGGSNALALELFMWADRALVRFEVLLGDAVEGERRDTTLQARSRDTPVTVGTAPAGELFVFDPDHTSWHACTLRGCWIRCGIPAGGEEQQNR